MYQEYSAAIGIFLASTHTIFRTGLRNLLSREPDLRIVGEAGEAAETVKLIEETNPDVLLLDWPLRGLAKDGQLGGLRMLFDKTRTLLLSSGAEHVDPAEALREGAGGLVLKNSGSDMLIQGIRNLAQGQYWVGDAATADRRTAVNRAAGHIQPVQPKVFNLTARELEVVQEVVSGYSNREIADRLTISEDTVKHHLSNIFNKVGVYNRLELALFAIHHGLTRSLGRDGDSARNEE
ncbi:MAG: response regulator transcription factor [Acidobacteria bacterium]|nr:response regulator transcription factor [Acidobacteriota bacterium]